MNHSVKISIKQVLFNIRFEYLNTEGTFYMNADYSVAISCHNDLGFIEYDSISKAVNIVIDNTEIKERIQAFLNTSLTIQIPHETLHDFTTVTINPLADIDSFQLALTRLWEITDVHVDWSRPVEYVKNGIRSLKDL